MAVKTIFFTKFLKRHITAERPIHTIIFPVDEQVASFRYFFCLYSLWTFTLVELILATAGSRLQGKAANQSAEDRNVSKKLMEVDYYLMAKETTLCFCVRQLNKEAS